MVWRQGRKATFQSRSPFRQSTGPDGRLRSVGGDLRRGLESHCTLCQHTLTQYVNLLTFCFAQRKHVKRKLDIVLKLWKVIKLISWFLLFTCQNREWNWLFRRLFFHEKCEKRFQPEPFNLIGCWRQLEYDWPIGIREPREEENFLRRFDFCSNGESALKRRSKFLLSEMLVLNCGIAIVARNEFHQMCFF